MQGETVSHYRIEDQIGAGAMGHVYRATDIRSGVRVAVKFMQADPADPDYAEAEARFAREAHILAQLRHENIVQILAAGRHGALPFLVMEHVDAPSLKELVHPGLSCLFVLQSSCDKYRQSLARGNAARAYSS